MRRFIGAIAAAIVLTGASFAGGSLAQAATPLVDVDWVKANLGNEDVVFLDVRGPLDGASKADYLKAHIPGAIWTDYLQGGWRMKDANGTIAQLPEVSQLEALISNLGIDNEHHVVIVPAGGSALDVGTATRVYWTFKVLGHDQVSILDGGMRAYTAERDAKTKAPVNPLESGDVVLDATIFEADLQTDMLIGKAEMQQARSASKILVDNRPVDQFLGINKHGAAKRYGTIPGARNLPEDWLIDKARGTFRDPASTAKLYQMAGVPTEGEQISFCNTGHWASLGWFVSHELLGNDKAKLYDGSMVEWSADKTLEMHTALQW